MVPRSRSAPSPHPNSGLPEFGTLSWPKSDKSDFGWERGGVREQTELAARAGSRKITMPNYVTWLLKLAFTIAILCAIVAKADFRQIFATLSLIAPVSVLVGLALAFLQSGIAAARLSIVIALYQRRLPLWDSFRVTLESAFFSQTFVSFLGGDALRIWRDRKST